MLRCCFTDNPFDVTTGTMKSTKVQTLGTLSCNAHRCQLSRNVRDSHGIVGHVPCPALIAALSRIFCRSLSLLDEIVGAGVGKRQRNGVERSVILIRRRSDFQAIHRSSKGNTFARCVLCSSNFSISHGERRDITTHVSGERHQEKGTLTSKSVSTYFSQHNDLL